MFQQEVKEAALKLKNNIFIHKCIIMNKKLLCQLIREEIKIQESEKNDNDIANDNLNKLVGVKPNQGAKNQLNPDSDINQLPGIDKLAKTEKEHEWKNKIKLPSLETGDAGEYKYSVESVQKWVEKFRSKFGEMPRFIKDKNGFITVKNEKFIKWKQDYIDGKSKSLGSYNNID